MPENPSGGDEGDEILEICGPHGPHVSSFQLGRVGDAGWKDGESDNDNDNDSCPGSCYDSDSDYEDGLKDFHSWDTSVMPLNLRLDFLPRPMGSDKPLVAGAPNPPLCLLPEPSKSGQCVLRCVADANATIDASHATHATHANEVPNGVVNEETPQVNKRGLPCRAAASGVDTFLREARVANRSRACVFEGPRGIRSRSVQQAVLHQKQYHAEKRSASAPPPIIPFPTTPPAASAYPTGDVTSFLCQKYKESHCHIAKSILFPHQSATATDKFVAQVLKGERQVRDALDKRRHVSERTVRDRLKALKEGKPKGKPGPRPHLTKKIEDALLHYIDVHMRAKLCRYQHEVWRRAGQLAAEGGILGASGRAWVATKGWWYGFKRRHPQVVSRVKEALASERAHAEDPVENKEWHDAYASCVKDLDLPPERVWILDEAGAFFGYGRKEKVVALKGVRTAARAEREEREWFSVMGGGCAAGERLPPCYFFRRAIPPEFRDRPDCYAIRVPKGFNTCQAWAVYVQRVLLPHTGATPERPHVVLSDGHRSRMDLDTCQLMAQSGIRLFLLRPHTTHFVCVLDTHCFGPMKRHFVSATGGTTKRLSADLLRFTQLFNESYHFGISSQNLKKGFRDTGLYPPDWDMLDRKCDGWRERDAIRRKMDTEQEEQFAEELAAVTEARRDRVVTVHVVYDLDPKPQTANSSSAEVVAEPIHTPSLTSTPNSTRADVVVEPAHTPCLVSTPSSSSVQTPSTPHTCPCECCCARRARLVDGDCGVSATPLMVNRAQCDSPATMAARKRVFHPDGSVKSTTQKALCFGGVLNTGENVDEMVSAREAKAARDQAVQKKRTDREHQKAAGIVAKAQARQSKQAAAAQKKAHQQAVKEATQKAKQAAREQKKRKRQPEKGEGGAPPKRAATPASKQTGNHTPDRCPCGEPIGGTGQSSNCVQCLRSFHENCYGAESRFPTFTCDICAPPLPEVESEVDQEGDEQLAGCSLPEC